MASTERLDYPSEVVRDLQRLGDNSVALLDGDPDAAKTAAVAQLDLIRKAEENVGHPLHKGQPLFNIATAESNRSHQAARGWFISAFMEDARLDLSGLPATPASIALTSVYGYDNAGLERMAAVARQDSAADPVELGQAIADRDSSNPLDLPYDEHAKDADLDGIARDELVFVGGSYRYENPNVVDIARGVRQAGFRPVVVKTFPDRPGESARKKSFRLLDRCGSAAFDGSGVIAPGWVNEVEHIARAPIPTLIVHSADREDRDPNYSTTLPAIDEIPGLVTRAFTDQRRLSALVAAWLTERVSRPLSPATGQPGPQIDPKFITASGLGYAHGSNTTYSGGSASIGSGYPEAAVGSGGSYPDPMQDPFDHRQDMERLARRLASGKIGPLPPLIRDGRGMVRELGQPSASEPEEEEGPDPTKAP